MGGVRLDGSKLPLGLGQWVEFEVSLGSILTEEPHIDLLSSRYPAEFSNKPRKKENYLNSSQNWNKSYTLRNLSLSYVLCLLKHFLEQQQHGFSYSTPRLGSERLQKSAKSLLRALQLISIFDIEINLF